MCTALKSRTRERKKPLKIAAALHVVSAYKLVFSVLERKKRINFFQHLFSVVEKLMKCITEEKWEDKIKEWAGKQTSRTEMARDRHSKQLSTL